MQKLDFKAIIKPALVLTVICTIAALLLGVSNALTVDRIDELAAKTKAESMQKVLPADEYKAAADGIEFYTALKDGKISGYAALCAARGYGGDIEVMVGLDTNGKIAAIDIVSCGDETPGLGQNIKTDEFKSRFAGISGAAEIGGNVDGWSGATISSKGVAAAVNQAFELYKKYK